MECPVCKDKAHVEIDTHSDGYAKNLQECGECGALWLQKDNQAVLIHSTTRSAA